MCGSKTSAPFLNLCLKSWIELHYMVWLPGRGQRREPVGRPELPPPRGTGKEDTVSVDQTPKQKRRFLTSEKKFQIFLETQSPNCAVGEVLRREGIYSTDLARIRQKVKEGALERLADRPGAKRQTVSKDDYEALKKELEEKERALADLSVELAVLRKKTNGGSWER